MENNLEERLEALKIKLGLKWNELAAALNISVPLLGFIRRGDRPPSERVLNSIVALEQTGISAKTATDAELHMWKSRALTAERKLDQVSKALKLVLQGASELQEAVK